MKFLFRLVACFSVAIVSTSPAFARAKGCFGAGEPLFHCTLNGGRTHLDLCLQDRVVIYRYGPPNDAVELFLARNVTEIDQLPWNGVGRSIYEELTIRNGTFGYTVAAYAERQPGAFPEGQVTFTDGERVLAELKCDPGTAFPPDFTPLFNAKERAGHCWDQAEFIWKDC